MCIYLQTQKRLTYLVNFVVHTAVNSKDETISRLKLEVLSSKGILNCRGLLEQLLIDVQREKGYQKHFNATTTCKDLGKGTGRAEQILINTGDIIFNEFPDRNLARISRRNSFKLYSHLYRQLSTKIHEQPNYGGKVGRMICMQLYMSYLNDLRLQFHQAFHMIGNGYSPYWPTSWELPLSLDPNLWWIVSFVCWIVSSFP